MWESFSCSGAHVSPSPFHLHPLCYRLSSTCCQAYQRVERLEARLKDVSQQAAVWKERAHAMHADRQELLARLQERQAQAQAVAQQHVALQEGDAYKRKYHEVLSQLSAALLELRTFRAAGTGTAAASAGSATDGNGGGDASSVPGPSAGAAGSALSTSPSFSRIALAGGNHGLAPFLMTPSRGGALGEEKYGASCLVCIMLSL